MLKLVFLYLEQLFFNNKFNGPRKCFAKFSKKLYQSISGIGEALKQKFPYYSKC